MILDVSVKKVFYMELYIPDKEYKKMSEDEIKNFIFSESDGVDFNDIDIEIDECSERSNGFT